MIPIVDLDNPFHRDLSERKKYLEYIRAKKRPVQVLTPEGNIKEVILTNEEDVLSFSKTPSPGRVEYYANAFVQKNSLTYVILAHSRMWFKARPFPGTNFNDERVLATEDTIWEQFCEGISKSTTITYFNLSGVKFCKLSDIKWKQFCEAIAQNSSITKLTLRDARLDMLSKSRLESFSIALKTNRTIIELNLHQNFLSGLNEARFEILFSALFDRQISFTTLDLRDNLLLNFPDFIWAKFCARLMNDSRCQKLKICNAKAVVSEKWIRRNQELGMAIQKNGYLKELNATLEGVLQRVAGSIDKFEPNIFELIEQSSIHKLKLNIHGSFKRYELDEAIWEKCCESISKSQYLTQFSLRINGAHTDRKKEMDEALKTRIKDRHSQAFTFAHCLRQLQFNKNPVLSALPKGIVSNILTYFEVKPLCDQVEKELNRYRPC